MKPPLETLSNYFLEELKSRVHPLHSLTFNGLNSFVKRDDELSFSSSGSKVRKLSSLIPSIKSKKPRKVGVIGSELSHFVLALTQRLIENRIPFICYLKKAHKEQFQGNSLLLRLLRPEIVWINSSDWGQVEPFAKKSCDLIIPEGGFLLEAWEGCCSLALDVARNEEEIGVHFDHIVVDAGSSFTAISLILFYALYPSSKIVHVVSCADSEETFKNKLEELKKQIRSKYLFEEDIPLTYKFYRPVSGKSFGSTPQVIFNYIQKFAQTEGVLLDPLYSAKLFQTFETSISPPLKGNALVIHSGGGTSLFSFGPSLLGLDAFSSKEGRNHKKAAPLA